MTPKKIKRRFKKISIKFLWPIFPALVLIGLVILLSKLQTFNIQKVTCQLDDHPCSLEFESVLISFYNQNIFKLNRSQVVGKLTQFDSTLSDIKLKKQLPSTLNIFMQRRLAIAQLIPVENLQFEGLNSSQSATLSGQILDQFFRLDKTGEIYQKVNQKNPQLPEVLVSTSFPLSLAKIDLTEKLAKLITSLNLNYVKYSRLAWLSSNQIIIHTSLGPYAVLDSTQNLDSAVASLQYILTNIKIDSKLPNKVDLRFDKPVLSF